jgi:hypothetical protein
MTMQRKRVVAVVRLATGELASQWGTLDFRSFTKQLNGGLGECVIKLGVPFDYDGADLREGNDVELYVVDADSTDGNALTDGLGARLIYKGYVSLIEREVSDRADGVTVHLLGYYTLLSTDVLKNGSQTTLYSHSTDGLTITSASQGAADVGLLVRSIVARYRAETARPKIHTDLYAAPNSGTAATYTFQQDTYRAALDKLKSLAPEGVYWYVNEYGQLSFKEKPSSPTHKFVFGKDFSEAKAFRSLEKVRNVLLLWDGASLYKQYEDVGSVSLYGRRVEVMNDFGVANSNAADLIGAKFLAENKDPDIRVVCTINDNLSGKGYDIESIQPGDTCDFIGFSSGLDNGLADIFRGNMLITRVEYALDHATIEVEIARSGIVDLQARQGRAIADIGSGGLGVPATYS